MTNYDINNEQDEKIIYEMSTGHKMEVVYEGSRCLYKVRFVDNGALPSNLSGMFTSIDAALTAIKRYDADRNKVTPAQERMLQSATYRKRKEQREKQVAKTKEKAKQAKKKE